MATLVESLVESIELSEPILKPDISSETKELLEKFFGSKFTSGAALRLISDRVHLEIRKINEKSDFWSINILRAEKGDRDCIGLASPEIVPDDPETPNTLTLLDTSQGITFYRDGRKPEFFKVSKEDLN